MKKIILIPFLFIATFCFAQYPNGIQTLGNDSNMVVAKGGFTAKGGVQVANYVDTTAANLSRIRQYSGATIFTTSDNVFWVRNGTATAWLKIGSNVSPAGTDCSLIGGIVTPATGLTFDITMASYCISDTPHVYSGGQITLDAADASLPRIDVIGLDNTGNAFKITGIPATDPAVPQVDPSTQLYLTHVYISAGATAPTGVSSYTIWDENTEWTGSATGVTVDFNNTSTVYHLTKSTDVGIHTTNDLVSYAGSGVHLQGYNVVKFFINLKSAMPANRNISIGLFTNSQPMTNYLTLGAAHGFNKSLVGQWQVVSVPLTDFNYLSESPLTGLKFRIQGAGAGFYLDWITLHGGLPINTGSNAITNVYRIAGTTNVMKVVNGVASLAFVDSVGGGSADSIVVVQQPLQSLPSGVSGVPDTLKFNADSSGLVKLISKKAGTDSVFQTINGIQVFAYIDSSYAGGSGSVEYVIPGYGVRVDSVGRNYTVNVDTSIIAKKDSIRLQQPLYVVGDTMKFNPDSSGLVKDIYKKAGTDSVFKKINGVDLFAYKDSVGGGGSGGISQLGNPGFGLTRINDSTYNADTTVSGLSGKYVRLTDAIPYTINTPSNNTLFKYDSVNNRFVNFKLAGVYPVAYNDVTGEISSSGGLDTAFIQVVANGISSPIPNNKGFAAKNHILATSTVPQSSPPLIFKAAKWNGSTSVPVFWRMFAYGAGGSHGYALLQSSNDSTTWTNGVQFDETSGLTAFGIIAAAGYTGNAQYGNNSMNIRADGTALFGAIGAPDTRAQIELRTSTKGFLHARGTTAVSGRVSTLPNAGSITTGGSGYTNGAFSNIPMSGGSGTGLTVTIVVTGGAVTNVTNLANGYGYRIGDVLSYDGTGGTGFTYTITSLRGTGVRGLQYYDSSRNILYTWNGVSNQGDHVTTSSDYTLLYGTDVTFTGTSATFTAPAVNSSYIGRANSMIIMNKGSGTITLNAATGSELYTTSAQSTINIAAGASCQLFPDGTHLKVLYNN